MFVQKAKPIVHITIIGKTQLDLTLCSLTDAVCLPILDPKSQILSINIRHNIIPGADNCDQIGDGLANGHQRHDLNIGKAGASNAGAVRISAPVADNVIALFTPGNLAGDISLALRDPGTPGDIHKMMDQAFNILQHILALRNDVAVVVGYITPFRHIGGCLFDNFQTLAHFLDPHQITGITVSIGVRGNLKVKIFIAGIWKCLAQIPLQTAGPQIRPGDPPIHGILQGQASNAPGSGPEDGIFSDQGLAAVRR